MEQWFNLFLQAFFPVLKSLLYTRPKNQLRCVPLEPDNKLPNQLSLPDVEAAKYLNSDGPIFQKELLQLSKEIHDLIQSVGGVVQQTSLDWERWQFQKEKALQQQLVAYQRETLLELAAYQRETTLKLPEINKIIENWPLRLFPSQLLESSDRNENEKIPLRIFLALPNLEYDSLGNLGVPDLEPKIAQGLREFLSQNYSLHSQVRPTEFLGGVWQSKNFHSESSIKALFGMLKSEPTLVLESEIEGDNLYFRMAYWGLGQQTYCYETLFKLPYRELIDASAKARAKQWKKTRDQLLALGKNLADIKRWGGNNYHNLAILEEEEELQQAGVDTSELTFSYEANRTDWDNFKQFLSTCHCLVAGWMADIHHLVSDDVSPQLPKLLPQLTQNLPDQQLVQLIMATTASIYENVFEALTIERPCWKPELALKLAQSLTHLPDRGWAEAQLDYSLHVWLQQRQVSPRKGRIQALQAMHAVLTRQDEEYCQTLRDCLVTLGEEQGVSEVESLLEAIASLKAQQTLANVSLVRTFGGFSEQVSALAISPDGQTLMSGGDNNTIKLWQLGTNLQPVPQSTLNGNSGKVLTLTCSGQTLASSTQGKDRSPIQIWDLNAGKLRRSLFGHKKPILALAISPEGQILASGSHKIKLWNLPTGEPLQTLFGHKKGVYSLAFGTDGQTLVSGSEDHTVKIWNPHAEQTPRVLAGHQGSVRSVAISLDGQMIISGSDDQTIKLWDAQTGKLHRTLTGHAGAVYTVAITPDGKHLITGSEDKTIKIWEIATGELLQTLAAHRGAVGAIATSPDGQTIASASEDKTIGIWQVL